MCILWKNSLLCYARQNLLSIFLAVLPPAQHGLYTSNLLPMPMMYMVYMWYQWLTNCLLYLCLTAMTQQLFSLTITYHNKSRSITYDSGWLMLMWLLNFVEGFDFITVSSASCYISLHTLYPPQHIENSILAISITGALWSTATTTTGIPLPSGK